MGARPSPPGSFQSQQAGPCWTLNPSPGQPPISAAEPARLAAGAARVLQPTTGSRTRRRSRRAPEPRVLPAGRCGGGAPLITHPPRARRVRNVYGRPAQARSVRTTGVLRQTGQVLAQLAGLRRAAASSRWRRSASVTHTPTWPVCSSRTQACSMAFRRAGRDRPLTDRPARADAAVAEGEGG